MGGEDGERNISVVLKSKHRAWTALFDNFGVNMIAKLFQKYWELFGDGSRHFNEIKKVGLGILLELETIQKYGTERMFTELEFQRVQAILLAYKSELKKWHAWRHLFTGKTLHQIVDEINKVWIDPDYKLIVEVVQTKEIKAVSVIN